MVDRFTNHLAYTLCSLRLKQGLTQTAVAKAMKNRGFPFHQPTVQRIETAEREVRAAELLGFAGLFGQPVTALLGTDGAVTVEPEFRDVEYNIRNLSTGDLVRINALVGEILLGRHVSAGGVA